MSLNGKERARASLELQTSYQLAGLHRQDVVTDLGLSAEQLDAVLTVRPGVDPAQVWLLRDYLDQALRDHGREPAVHIVLTDAAREDAVRWFHLRPAPPATRRG